ncbi:MAG: dihydrodipicolinate synthase family protein [Rhodomicrobiaceae bacterium]
MPQLSGIFAASATPLTSDLEIDHDRLVDHCRWLMDEMGCDGVNLLGTTGEATSFSVEQRIGAMRAIADSGLPMSRFMVGTGAAAMQDALTLTRTACELGFAGALLLPPFYYKSVEDDALEAYVAAIIEQAVSGQTGLYLYHFPAMSSMPYPIEIVARLAERFPGVLAGIKDSSGDLAHAQALLSRVPSIAVFPGAETLLAQAPDAGFAGCISATANVTASFISRGWKARTTEEGQQALKTAADIRAVMSQYPTIPAVKRTLAKLRGDDNWRRVHPPLAMLSDAAWNELDARLEETELFTG